MSQGQSVGVAALVLVAHEREQDVVVARSQEVGLLLFGRRVVLNLDLLLEMFHIAAQVVLAPPVASDFDDREPPVDPANRVAFGRGAVVELDHEVSLLRPAVGLRVVGFPTAQQSEAFLRRFEFHPGVLAFIEFEPGIGARGKPDDGQFAVDVFTEVAETVVVECEQTGHLDGALLEDEHDTP